MSGKILAEYIWIDGKGQLRSKTRVLDKRPDSIENVPEWGVDGSSTYQAPPHKSDRHLTPVRIYGDPIDGDPHILVLCEVFYPEGKIPHETNKRLHLRHAMMKYGKRPSFDLGYDPLCGLEQEYNFYYLNSKGDWLPLGWKDDGTPPPPQGDYYCGIGASRAFGRGLKNEHLKACVAAGIHTPGTNGEVMPGQWEFQIGTVDPLTAADDLWVARALLLRIGEKYGLDVRFDPKPMEGDWNGAGLHTNFSTKKMMEEGGLEEIKEACVQLAKNHKEHIAVYGKGNDKRLTGFHETASITQFGSGKEAFSPEKFSDLIGNRGASVRINEAVAKAGRGYLEDRRPAANADPYEVLTALVYTVCGGGFKLPPGREPDVKL